MLAEPSLVAVKPGTREVRAVGNGAYHLLEREGASITAVRPLRHGVITEFELTAEMLQWFWRKAWRGRRAHRRMVVGMPRGATAVARRALEEACLAAGAREAYLIDEPIAAAIGAGLPTAEAVGSLVVDIGGGTTEIALISLGDVVAWRSIPIGGGDFDDAIVKHLKREHRLLVSQRLAEQVKRQIRSPFPVGTDTRFELSGSEASSGVPKTVVITGEEIRAALETLVVRIVDAVKEALACTPPELASDILERGAVLAGGGALLKGLKERLRDETQMPVQVAELPLTCVAAGSGALLEEMNDGRFEEVTESWNYYN